MNLGPFWCEQKKSWLRIIASATGIHAELALSKDGNTDQTHWEPVLDKGPWIIHYDAAYEGSFTEGLCIANNRLFRTDFTQNSITQKMNVLVYDAEGLLSLFNQDKAQFNPFASIERPDTVITPYEHLPLTPDAQQTKADHEKQVMVKSPSLNEINLAPEDEQPAIDWYKKIQPMCLNDDLIPQGLSNQTYAKFYKLMTQSKLEITAPWQLIALTGNTDFYMDFLALSDNHANNLGHYAAWSGNTQALQWVNDNKPVLLETKNTVGGTIALFAAWSGNPQTLQWVKENMPTLFEAQNATGNTIAHFAAWSGNPQALQWVKDNMPIPLDIKNTNGSNIAHFAAWSGNPQALQWVKDNMPILLETENTDGENLAYYAARSGNPQALQWVKDNMSSLLEANNGLGSITHSTAMSGNPRALQWIKDNMSEIWKSDSKNPDLLLSNTTSVELFEYIISLVNVKVVTIDLIAGNSKQRKLKLNALSQALAGNIALSTLHIQNARPSEIAPLIKSLETNFHLTKMTFEEIKLEDRSQQKIHAYLKRNQRYQNKFFSSLEHKPYSIFSLLYDLCAAEPELTNPNAPEHAFLLAAINACSDIELNTNPLAALNLLHAACSAKMRVPALEAQLAQFLFSLDFKGPEKYRLILWVLRHNLNDTVSQRMVRSCVAMLQNGNDQGILACAHQPGLFLHQQQLIDAALKLEQANEMDDPLFKSMEPQALLNEPLIRDALGLIKNAQTIIIDNDLALADSLPGDKELVARLITDEATHTIIKIETCKQAVANAMGKYNLFLNDKSKDNREEGLGFFTRFRHGEYGRKTAADFATQVAECNEPSVVIQHVLALLNKPQTRFHNHSFATYLLAELKDILIALPHEATKPNTTELKTLICEQLEEMRELLMQTKQKSLSFK